jgi:hypothetical protein
MTNSCFRLGMWVEWYWGHGIGPDPFYGFQRNRIVSIWVISAILQFSPTAFEVTQARP